MRGTSHSSIKPSFQKWTDCYDLIFSAFKRTVSRSASPPVSFSVPVSTTSAASFATSALKGISTSPTAQVKMSTLTSTNAPVFGTTYDRSASSVAIRREKNILAILTE